MNKQLYSKIILAAEVRQALEMGLPVVALESTVITHGLPYPQNLQLAQDMEAEVRQQNAVPATVGVRRWAGLCWAGRRAAGSAWLQGKELVKVSVRDFGPAMALGLSGGTTVAGTLLAANLAGLRVFATGGIGGVHREAPFDVSTDLVQLARTPLVVVCAGAKAILDLPATLEVLETYGVPVIGYQTDEFPAFYSPRQRFAGERPGGYPRAGRPGCAGALGVGYDQRGAGVRATAGGRCPARRAGDMARSNRHWRKRRKRQIHGQQVTPFLLQPGK